MRVVVQNLPSSLPGELKPFVLLAGFLRVSCRVGLGGWLGLAACLAGVPPAPVPVEREAPWRIANFAADAGVARRMVFDVAFETNNTAWFAGSDGLYRYDGYGWRRFGIADGLPSSFIRTVFVTRDGSVWVGTDKGAGVFDGATFDRRGTGVQLAGPNVRRIVETADGSLWFCCDRWPDATTPGGLTRLQGGEFRTYGVGDGLPSDHLLNLFEQSNGRVIALTGSGPAVRTGDRWTPLADEGYPANDHTWAMVETPDGGLFAQGFEATLVQIEGRWSVRRATDQRGTEPLCVTREGAVIMGAHAGDGTVTFMRWDGQAFVKASGSIADEGVDLHVLRQAPDGAIWAVGRGTILRWTYLPGAWEARPDLPRPVLEDREHRLWFADENSAAVLEGEALQIIPEMRAPLVEDGQGAVWGAGAAGVVRWAQGRLETVSPEVCGLATLLAGVTDASGALWLYGPGAGGGFALACFHEGGWQVVEPAPLKGRQFFSMVAHPQGGIWAVLADDTSVTNQLIRVTREGLERVEPDGGTSQTRRPLLSLSRTHLYLSGYHGLWEAPLGDRLKFTRVEVDAGRVFSQAASIPDASVFVTQESVDGKAAILVKRENSWLRQGIVYGEALWLGQDGWLMVADGARFALWQVREWDSAAYVSLPTDTTIVSMLRSTDGAYWLGTYQGVLHLRPGTELPDTVLTGPGALLAGVATFEAEASGVAPFTPQAQASHYSFTWRLDSGPWSGYGDWPAGGIPLAGVSPGKHLLEARARDGLGNEDPTPASLAFEILAVPIQDRAWFRFALAGLGLVLAALSLALFGATRRLRRYAGNLEEQVLARTTELRKDIARRQQVESDRERLVLAIEQTADIIVITDASGTIQYVNRTFERVTGYTREEALGRNPRLLKSGRHDAAFYRQMWAVLNRGETWNGRLINRRKDGTLYTEEATISPVRDRSGRTVNYVAAKRDVTDELRLQEQLVQAQKMESVGRLAGGVAHDFNNMLQAILGNAALALQDLPAQSPLRESLEEIEKSAQRSADLTRQLLAFARKQTIAPKVLDLNDTVAGMLKMLRRLMGEDIQLSWVPGAELWPIKMDPSQLDQVLANLCVNARDAIGGVGKVMIETANVTFDDTYVATHPEVMAGDYVVLAVSDTGMGMDAETRSHLFEPFFTTKEQGKGTGLGLATVFGIVKQNQGLINVYSEPGHGSTFKIYLPRSEAEAVAAAAGRGCEVRGTETVLLVEDEEQILNLGRRILEQHGYTVLTAPTPEAALAVAAQSGGPIHLLITDVVMPGMNGKELVARLRVGRPGLRCLYMSGYTANVIAHHGVLDAGVAFLQKPFTNQTLAEKAREVLEQPPESRRDPQAHTITPEPG